MNILAIDTSCDDTSAAVITKDGVASNIINSQDSIHNKYGGIVPEIAARVHFSNIAGTVKKAVSDAETSFDAIDKIAVTMGPGLLGSLLVGLSYAKGLAYRFDKKFIGVNHLEGHLYSPFIGKTVRYPFVGLVVSGGHTSVYKVADDKTIELLGRTRDDAAGECLDKTARLWNLGYPGGKAIDRMAEYGDSCRFSFPRTALADGSFSFSGLKSAAIRFSKANRNMIKDAMPDIAASFLEAVVDTLITGSVNACRTQKISLLAVSGGVSANKRLRIRLSESCRENGIELVLPDNRFTTDNAAMIGFVASMKGYDKNYTKLNASAISAI